MKATIITIGDEILIGQIVDTNSASIARHLNAAGIVVAEKESVGDDRDAIVAALRRAMDGSDVTILTGGLGPTKDDITKRTLAELFGCELVRDERVARHVRRMLESRGIAYNDLNRGQSLVPACCTVLFNAHGTAPGMWFERDGRVVVSLPGVPFEMEHLMQDEVMPRLKARFALRQIVHRTLITSGLAESMLAERIAGWEAALPPYLHLAFVYVVWEGSAILMKIAEKDRLRFTILSSILLIACPDRKSTRLNSSHTDISRMPSSA